MALYFYINFPLFCLHNLQYHSVVIARQLFRNMVYFLFSCNLCWIRHIALNNAYIHLPHRDISVGIFYTNISKTCQYLVYTCKANIVVVNYVKLQNFFKDYFQKSWHYRLDYLFSVVSWSAHYLEAIVQYNGKLTERYPNAYDVSMISFFNSSFTLLYIL